MGTTNPPLTESVIDSTQAPDMHAPPAGNWTDDDAAYTDDILEQNADLIPPASKTTGVDMGVDKLPAPTRLITRTVPVISAGGPAANVGGLGPTMLMPKQIGRKGLCIMTDCDIYIAGEANLLNGAGIFRAAPVQAGTNGRGVNIWQIDSYTGPVWVQVEANVATPSSGALQVSAWAVVEGDN